MTTSAPPALGRESGVWLPIETAPKDGTSVLLFMAGGDGEDPNRTIAVGMWDKFDYCTMGWLMEAGDGWLSPSHWMPLPTPPAASFQARVDEWVQHCFGAVIRGDKAE